MFKKALAIALVMILVLSVTGCADVKDLNGDSSLGNSSNNPVDDIPSSNTSNTTPGPEVFETELNKKDYGNRQFSFYYQQDVNVVIQRTVSAFNEAFNAKVEIKVLSGNFEENIATSIAEGAPFDLIANHDMYFPNSMISNLLEPLDGHIDELDYFNALKPENGGLSRAVNANFTLSGKIYAAGSSRSVGGYVFYYNRKLFDENGFKDPYKLWKDGKWTWDKVKEMGTEVTDVKDGVYILALPELNSWLTVSGVSAIKRDGDSFTQNLDNKQVIKAIKDWKTLLVGKKQIATTDPDAFISGNVFAAISVTDNYSALCKAARNSEAFDKNASNLGIAVIPDGLCADSMYPAGAAQGYSAAKGAVDPSIAACYALFESRAVDRDVGSGALPAEIEHYIWDAFSEKGFLGYGGFADSKGNNIEKTVNSKIGSKILDGEDIDSTVKAQRSALTKIINDVMSQAK